MLSPERQGAWFRESPKIGSSAFSSGVGSEPVFAMYEASQAMQIRSKIEQNYLDRAPSSGVFPVPGPSLWGILLDLNCQLELVAILPEPFAGLRLDHLPDGLPEALHSTALTGFLANVKKLYSQTRSEVDQCYQMLWKASTELWHAQAKEKPRSRSQDRASERQRTYDTGSYKQQAEDLRAGFRKRRGDIQGFRAIDVRAMQFMNFQTLPSMDQLRRRYHDLAKKMHPDLVGGDAESFKNLSLYYSHLTKLIRSREEGKS
jgi:hypothetical protein